jgi:hypothetical protein
LSICLFHNVFTTPKPFGGDFDETWYKERSHCGDVHIVRGPLSNYFSRSCIPGFSMFFEKYFVFVTPPKPFGG